MYVRQSTWLIDHSKALQLVKDAIPFVRRLRQPEPLADRRHRLQSAAVSLASHLQQHGSPWRAALGTAVMLVNQSPYSWQACDCSSLMA